LTISGPAEGGAYPSLQQFLTREFGGTNGTYAYLSGALDGSGGMFQLLPRQVDQHEAAPTTVSEENGIVVQAVGVDHGPVPALGYLVTVADYHIAFSGDMRGSRVDYWQMIEGADLLFMDHAVPQDAGAVASNLHATPDTIGRRAASFGIERLVLSHLMQRSLASLQENIRIIRKRYSGTIDVADDLLCYSL
jgi:ribonuclease BN (tRNA processing enzyme)